VAIDPKWLVCLCGQPKEPNRVVCATCRARVPVRATSAVTAAAARPVVAMLTAAERQASARKSMARRVWWTKKRVIEGLQRFYQDFKQAPHSTRDYHVLVKGSGMGPRRRYPSFYAVLKHWATFRQAWEAAGIHDNNRAEEAWSPAENWYVREAMGILTRNEIAADLRRTPDALHRHIYDMGWSTWDAHGWSVYRLERTTGLPANTFRRYMAWGDLPFFKGTKVVYIDPGDLTCVAELDFEHLPPDLEEAMVRALRERLVKVLAGQDWRAGRLHTAQPTVKGRYLPGSRQRYPLKPAPKPNGIEPGMWAEVIEDVPDRPGVFGRVGFVHLVYPANAKYSYVRSGGTASLWMARVEFKSLHDGRKRRAPRVTYSLPLTVLKQVDEPAVPIIQIVRGLEQCGCGEFKLPGRDYCWRCREVLFSNKTRRDVKPRGGRRAVAGGSE
jgi:hypothetical protein